MNQRVNMDINKNLWKQVGIRAIKEGITKKELVEKAFEKYLKEEKKMTVEGIKKALVKAIQENPDYVVIEDTEKGGIWGSTASLSTLKMGGGKLFIIPADEFSGKQIYVGNTAYQFNQLIDTIYKHWND